jgi:hypothetical protein
MNINIGLQAQKMALVFMNPKVYKICFINLIVFLILPACLILGEAKGSLTPPPCPTENLMLDKALFPEGWSQHGPPSLRNAPIRWGVDRLGVSFGTQENGVANQVVHVGRNLNQAEEGYFDLVTSWFDTSEDATDWYIPSKFSYKNTVANRYRFGCRTYRLTGFESCQLVGQYGIYLVQFHTAMSPIMTYDDLARILRAIDDKMAKCLGK